MPHRESDRTSAPPPPSRRDALAVAGRMAAAGTAVLATRPLVGMTSPAHAANALTERTTLAMHGEPALPDARGPFPYVHAAAPKGGRLVVGLNGTFDSLNPYAVRGVAPDAAPKFVWQSLMMRSLDEPFSLYALVAENVAIADDRSRAVFRLRREARFSDGTPLTSADVAFSFELLKTKGKPFFRSAYGRVARFETPDPHRVEIALKDASDRELLLLIALMPIFAKHATDPASFDGPSLTPPIGSGPYVLAEVKPGESLTLRRDPTFWGKDLPLLAGLYNLDEIRTDFFRDTNTMFEAFKAGLIDLRFETDPGRWTTGYDFPALREGRVVAETLPNGNPKGMNAFAFNTRRPLLADVRVREALSLMFDFDWVNRNLYSGVYRRTTSFFEGSDLASTGIPASSTERALLAPFAGTVREDILAGTWRPGGTDGSGRDREQARRALALLAEAGWRIVDGDLRQVSDGAVFAPEILVASRAQERLALNFARALSPLGIAARIRLVDDAQYWRRLTRFEFDIIQYTWTGSLSPGAEQLNRWGSGAAERQGSLNYPGVRQPAADAAIAALLAARERRDFVDAARALDRVLLSGFYVMPLFHAPDQWIARAASVKRPERRPLTGLAIETLWRE